MGIRDIAERANVLRGQIHILKEVLSEPEDEEWYSVEVYSSAAKIIVEVDYTIGQYRVREILLKELEAKERHLNTLELALGYAEEAMKEVLGDGYELE